MRRRGLVPRLLDLVDRVERRPPAAASWLGRGRPPRAAAAGERKSHAESRPSRASDRSHLPLLSRARAHRHASSGAMFPQSGQRCPARCAVCSSAWRSASCSPRTTTSCARACGACSRRSPSSRSSPPAATSTRCSPPSRHERPTSSSPTSACRRRARRGHPRRASSLRETHPDVGVVVLSQYAEPRYALALLEGGTRAARLPAEGARRRRRRSSSRRSGRSRPAAR